MDYITEMIFVINRVHQCAALHRATVPVREVFTGDIGWEGDVEVFMLVNHPKATKAFAWGFPVESEEERTITTVLALPGAREDVCAPI